MLDDDLAPTGLGPRTTEDSASGLETRALQARLQASLFDTATPVKIGDYVVVRPLGEGAMGTVFLAYDPDLDRRVAIKVIRGSRSGHDAMATVRMEREAKAMARLSHPNVVAVFEVGLADDQVFVAMEYVQGGTLAAWSRAHPVDSPARLERVLDLATQAARGLVAAHEAELVHRDLKPANILVGDDGRLRIADFGLARPRGEDDGREHSERSPPEGPGPARGDSRLTATGEIVGTPAYMAPEQFRGDSDERSDQFSWCATFFEALYGVRPFAGSNFHELLTAVEDGALVKPPANPHVPGWLRRLLERGLSADPAVRWPNMSAILDEIARRRRSRWSRVLGGVALVGIGVASALAYERSTDPAPTGPDCPSAAGQLERGWGDERKAAIRQAFTSTDAPYAQDAWIRVERGFDAVVRDWVEAKSEVCHAMASPDPKQAGLARRREACLSRSRSAIEFASEQLAEADADTVRLSARTVAGLRDRVRCDTEALLTVAKSDDLDVIDSTLAALDRADVLLDLHRLTEAGEVLDEAVARIPEEGFVSLRARAYESLINVAIQGDDWSAVGHNAHQLLDYAERSSDPGLHASAWVSLAVVARDEKHFEDAAFRLARADNIATHSRVTDTLRARIAQGRGDLYSAQQQHEQARLEYRKALEILEQAAPDSIKVAYALRDLADSMFAYGEGKPSIDALERSLAIHQDVLGPDHPDTAMAHLTLANIQVRLRDEDTLGHIDEAERILRANPEYRPSALGRVHELRGLDMMSRDGVDPDDELAKAQEIFVRTRGPDHSSVFHVRLFRANAMHTHKRYADAAAAYRALVEEFGPGDDMPLTFATARMNLADVEAMLGHDAFALEQIERARAVFDELFGAKGPIWRNTFINVARVYRNAGRPEVAEQLLEQIRAAAEASTEPIPAQEAVWLEIERARTALVRGRRDDATRIVRSARRRAEGENLPQASLLADLDGLEQALGIAPSATE